MRAYTLSVLSQLANTGNPIIEKEIVSWANNKLSAAGKTTSLRNFQDSAVADGLIVLDLIDSIKPGSVNYDLVKSSQTEEVRVDNNILFLDFVLNAFVCRTTLPTPSTPFRWLVKLAPECTPCPRTSLK